MQTAQFSGLHCQSCAKLIMKKLEKIPGVTHIASLETNGIFQITAEKPLTEKQIIDQLTNTEYRLVSLR